MPQADFTLELPRELYVKLTAVAPTCTAGSFAGIVKRPPVTVAGMAGAP